MQAIRQHAFGGPQELRLETVPDSASVLVQAVGAAGAMVVGVAGGQQKVALVRELGAAAAIDHRQPGWPEGVRAAVGERPVTSALDGVGGEICRAALELLGVGGRLVMFGSSSGALTELSAGDLYARGITASAAIGARMMRRPGGLRPLERGALQAAADGRLVPVVDQWFALADAGRHTKRSSRVRRRARPCCAPQP
jgi:NADPH:quinone reductase